MAQIAASIEHEAALPPSGLPDDMQALPGALLRYLAIKAIDGFKVQAALWQPHNKPPAETTIIVQVHGSGGNLASLPLRVIARALSARGYAALSISTRQHDEHVNTDNFFDVRRDIEAAVVTAKALGYPSILLQGHSLGTVQVAFYAATDWDPTIKAVILTGAFGKLPWKSRHVLIQDEERYTALPAASRRALKAGTAAEVLPIKMRWIGGVDTPVTPQHFLTYRMSRRVRPTAPTGYPASPAQFSFCAMRPMALCCRSSRTCCSAPRRQKDHWSRASNMCCCPTNGCRAGRAIFSPTTQRD
jgi:pimeloyl-ACP methyl ester carboxylesterase